jgi:hypothetical protein
VGVGKAHGFNLLKEEKKAKPWASPTPTRAMIALDPQ